MHPREVSSGAATPEPRSSLRAGLVLPVRVGTPGGPTRKQARGPRWRRTSRGFYVPSSVSRDDVDQRIVEAAVLAPPHGAVTGWAALKWMGGRWFGGRTPGGEDLPVPIVIGTHDIRPQPGIRLSGEGVNPTLVQWVDGIGVTDPRYAVSFEARYAPDHLRAVTALDMAAYSDLVSREEMADFFATQYAWTGIPQARAAWACAEENSWSPREVVLGHVWSEVAGFRRPLRNCPVFDLAGRHLGTPDVFDPEAGVAGEYDGEHHLVRRQRDHDLRREGDLRRVGIEIATMTAPDCHDPSAFISRLRTAYRDAARRPREERLWTIEKPKWWIPTETVEQRRALTPDQRRRLLAHRSA